jgi:hypothetical protein
MRISSSELTGVTGPESTAAQGAQRTGPGETVETQGAQAGDRVEFSSGLGRLASAISTYGANRAAQVRQLAALYQSGGYQPDSMATSRAMITEALGGN